MDGHFYYSRLTGEVKKAFNESFCVRSSPNRTFENYLGLDFLSLHEFENYLGLDFLSLHEFICYAFEWERTPYGFDYWWQVSESEHSLNTLVNYKLIKHKL